MNIVYLNPHADDFIATPVSFALANRRALKKYSYLFSEAIKESGNVDILLDGTLSSLLPQRMFMWLPRFIRILMLHVELFIWIRLNSLQGKVNIHWNTDSLEPNALLYLFSYKNCVAAFHERIQLIEFFERKVINLSHYFICTKEKAQNIAKLSNVILTSEADLTSNKYYQSFFKKDYPFIALPFQVSERFSATIPWSERKDKCAATGSFHNLLEERPHERYQDFIHFFNLDSYHPVRKLIYNNREALSDKIDCRISPYREKKRNVFRSLIERFFDTSQKRYFSFNIVDFYNDHKVALVGEEVHGLPAVGAFEAMACGCLLIVQDEFYKGLGLQTGKHFLSHSGNLETIEKAIHEALKVNRKNEQILENSIRYVEENCRAEVLWKKLLNELNLIK